MAILPASPPPASFLSTVKNLHAKIGIFGMIEAMKFTVAKLNKLSDICVAMGQVVFASIFVDPILSGSYNWIIIITGLLLAISVWSLSLAILNE